jgi:hypothetical protein
VANHQRLAAQALAQWEAGVQFLDLQGIPFEI